MSLETQLSRLQEHNRRCAVRIRNQRAEIRRLLAEHDGLRNAREALDSLLHDLETVPRTVDGVIARPGLDVYGDWGTAIIRKVCDGGKDGYLVEVGMFNGTPLSVPLSKCWSMPFYGAYSMKPILCPTCKRPCHLHVDERQGEGEDEELNLVGTHCLEAWAECPLHGWVSPRGCIESWGPERPMDEPLTAADRRQAVKGLRELMNHTLVVAHHSAE